LGHLAVQFAAKMGAEVVAIGRSRGKADESRKLGATEYISIDDEAAMKRHKHTLDLIICCANGSGMPYDKYMGLGALDSYFVLVALPEESLVIHPFTMTGTRVHVVGSSIGSISEIKEMLKFAGESGVRPMVEILPMSQVNEGIRKVKENDVKFRVVLEQGK